MSTLYGRVGGLLRARSALSRVLLLLRLRRSRRARGLPRRRWMPRPLPRPPRFSPPAAPRIAFHPALILASFFGLSGSTPPCFLNVRCAWLAPSTSRSAAVCAFPLPARRAPISTG